MWPGQQPPGGEQNPQDPHANPYQQPGYHQSNPYQQPGYQQPNPYQQNPAPQWNQGVPPGPPQPPQGGRNKQFATIAILTAAAVVAAAVITGVVVLGGDDARTDDAKKGGKPAGSAPSDGKSPGEEPSDEGELDNPRAGGDTEVEPVVPGWKTVVNAKRQNAFDVPPEWSVESQGTSIGFEDSKDKSDFPRALIVMSAPAFADRKWCTVKTESGYDSDTALAAAGTKGAQGARSTANAAQDAAEMWVYAGYDQNETGTRKVTKAKPFSSEHGLTGFSSSATVTGVKKTDKCSSDGKSFTVAYKARNGDLAIWSLYAAKGVKDEIPDATIKKIMNSLRPLKTAS
ncbi:hypothetical protein [Streptomyces sp. NPDC051776]|uniref:hypothetical protein n=1 Tax=Streptomyces sp. NPDC051776 TaxID=3155414 RepID=UPI003445CBC4